MIVVAVLAGWAAYGVGSWGWVLIKGYNIPFADWFNPVHPYQWPQGTPPMVPQGRLFPTTAGTGGQPALGQVGAEIDTGVKAATA